MGRPPKNVESVFKKLPPHAAPEVELAWCASHPLLMEVLKGGRDDKDWKPPEIMPRDLLHRGDGLCPSRSTVNRLFSYTRSIKAAESFVATMDSEAKKQLNQTVKEDDDDVKIPDTVQAIREILQTLD